MKNENITTKIKYPKLLKEADIQLKLHCLSYELATSEKQRGMIREDIERMLDIFGFNTERLFDELDKRRAERPYPKMNETIADELRGLCSSYVYAHSKGEMARYGEALEDKLKEHGFYSSEALEAIERGSLGRAS